MFNHWKKTLVLMIEMYRKATDRAFVFPGLLGSIILLAVVIPQPAKSFDKTTATNCDKYASARQDEERVSKAVEDEEIDIDRAINACLSAVQIVPENPRNHFHLARVYFAMGKKDEGLSELKVASDLGYGVATYYLGTISEVEHLGSGQLQIEAVELYKQAIRQKNQYAKYRLGLLLQNNWENESDLKQAFDLFESAAINGVDDALVSLAESYRYGRGVPRSEEKMVYYLKRYRISSPDFANFLLGTFYLADNSFNKNIEKSFYYLGILAENQEEAGYGTMLNHIFTEKKYSNLKTLWRLVRLQKK